MATEPRDAILLTWNPGRWPWEEIAEDADRAARGCSDPDDYWSVGNRREVPEGTRFYVIRLGREPRGIVASGWTHGPVFVAPHFDEAQRAAGKVALRVRIRFDRILDPSVRMPLPRSELDQPPFEGVHWSTQSSGIRIPGAVAEALERRWALHCAAAADS